MNAVLHDLGLWFWRLVPANPILVRVVSAGGRRSRHAWVRFGYLVALAAAAVGGVLFTMPGGSNSSLGDLAKGATQVFEYVSLLQLLMICVLAPIFTAAAITQEKDSQTYSILLSTPLSNGQIVLGSLLSRLYFILALLVAGVPLFCIMMVYGGVTGDKIALSSLLAACTATLTGSLAIAISVIRVGTGRTIITFYMAIAVYFVAIYALAGSNVFIPAEALPAPNQEQRMSWLAAFHPILSLFVVLGRTPAPAFGAVQHHGFPAKYFMAYPEYSYIVMTLLASAALIAASLFFVRRGSKEGEAGFFNRFFRSGGGEAGGGEKTRKPRTVDRNPVAWREKATRAGGAGAFVRYSLLLLGVGLGFTVLVLYGNKNFDQAQTRSWLVGLVAVQVGIALFISTATAATSMTREKESNTLYLLLSTPITCQYIIRGKIWGLVQLAWPMLAVPYATVVLFVLFDLITGRLFQSGGGVVPLEALLSLPMTMAAFTTIACIIGLQQSITNKRTLPAVFISVLIVGFIGSVGWWCGTLANSGSPTLAAVALPLSPYGGIRLALDPAAALADSLPTPAGSLLESCRVIGFIATAIISCLYVGLIGKSLYGSMVRNFDMTIRKQTA